MRVKSRLVLWPYVVLRLHNIRQQKSSAACSSRVEDVCSLKKQASRPNESLRSPDHEVHGEGMKIKDGKIIPHLSNNDLSPKANPFSLQLL